MREYISYKDIANTVMMMRSAFDGTIAVVEGVTDRRLYGKFIDSSNTEIVIAHSKDNVKSAVKEVYNERKMTSVIGIVDADLDMLFGKKNQPPLFLTDTRDSENMMFVSDAYYDVITELADPQLLKRMEDRYGDVRKRVMSAAYPIGILMYISKKNGLNLSFKDLEFENFISKRDLSCDERSLVDDILYNSGKKDIDPNTILNLMHKEASHPDEIVCRGHDIISIMAIGLREIFGANNSRRINDGALAGNFRLAFSEHYMKQTKLFSDSDRWCRDRGQNLWKVRD